MHETCVGGGAIFVGFWVINPDCLSCDGVDGCHQIERRAGVYHATNHERRGFIHHRPQIGIGFDERIIGGVPTPCNLKVLNIVFVNLIEWKCICYWLCPSRKPTILQPHRHLRGNNQTNCTKD